jgi:MtN3 and saliva related transmembrane protein
VTETLVGSLAAVITTVSFVPQVLRTARTRVAGDFAWTYLLLFAVGIGCWLAYGLLRDDVPIIASNAVVLSCVLLIIAVKGAERARRARAVPERSAPPA